MTAWGAPPPVVVDLGKSTTRKVLLGGSVTVVLGVLALVGAVSAFTNGEPAGGAIAAVIGVAFTGIGVLAAVRWKTISRPRKLVVEQQGIRLDDPEGAPWAVAWQDLGAVSISRTRERVVNPVNAVARRTMVRVDLHPRDPQRFRAAHPEMEPLWELHRVVNGYRLPLGDSAGFIQPIDHGLRTFAPSLYRGVIDEGFTVGLR
ncbi:hypothetical protein SAMN05216553_104505 [Lentzea fradiae]|uniref:Uncharacterized protein n=1 Tax=Lentzea fradiae TaxID=200378 RepID=A0A1G7QL89_9PSEU|nr:hypothetical protein [Lentzea fradiae]SDF99245.1 hypothetical protein SAMN05216553_104505 [Lentzea fradiae]